MKTEILYTENISAAKEEIARAHGKINQEFTEQLFAAQLPDNFSSKQLKFSTSNIPDNISDISRLAHNAWKSFERKSNKKDLAPDKREGLSWDTEGYESPKCMTPLIFPDTDVSEIQMSSNTPTSRYMIGSVAVGLVIASGLGALKFTDNEVQLIISEVQEALDFLAAAEPLAKVSFVYDIHVIDVNAPEGSTDNYESAESPWRNQALAKMGYAADRQGSIQYVNNLRATKGTNWAYIAYFTKYSLHHFAYAVNEKLVMNYYNDGWEPKFINRVFAHETCHIFGAADEYGNCRCDSIHGHLAIPNSNCRKCSPGGGVVCLMDSNDLTICDSTRKQIGWDTALFPTP